MTDPTWDSIEVQDLRGAVASEEPMGTKDKFWVAFDGEEWLFKFSRSDGQGGVRNEDWAEWIVYQLAADLGIPAAIVKPATCDGRRGILSRSVMRDRASERLVHGNELLHDFDRDYQLDITRANPGYTVEYVAQALRNVGPPRDRVEVEDFSGFDVMAGYLMLDALVAGRDRHHENWAAIESEGQRTLSPSFDHGNALGFQEPDHRAAALAGNPEALLKWLERGTSHHFAERPPLVSVAADAFALVGTDAGAYWRHKLRVLADDRIDAIVGSVPSSAMSSASNSFVRSLLKFNRERVADGIA
jgi:hypothetical protein